MKDADPDPDSRSEDTARRGAGPASPWKRTSRRPGAVRVVPDERWTAAAGTAVHEVLLEATALGGSASVALSGGSTPEPVYRWLAAARSPAWERVELFFGDERCVPPDDPESNYAMARRTLLEPLDFPSDRVHRMEAEREDRDAAAEAYGALLPERLTLLMLGIGPEGHTASLFPGSPALSERRRSVVPVHAPVTPPDRLTVTPPVLEAAEHVLVLARGEEKADAVARALEGAWAPELCPAQLVRKATWLLDPAGASRLARPGGGAGVP